MLENLRRRVTGETDGLPALAPEDGWTVVEGPTAHGGVLTEIFFYGEHGRVRDWTDAIRCLVREIDDRDRVVHERWCFIEPSGLLHADTSPPHSVTTIFTNTVLDVGTRAALREEPAPSFAE